ncbi:MAG: adenosylcobinamide-GDP ribazoletransferase [Bermanella sp.]
MFKQPLNLFFNAVTFYTRLPAPRWVTHSNENLNRASGYFPLIGWLVALISYGVFYAAHSFLPFELSLLISMGAGLLVTGAFHEDGFADLCDGFGGGWSQQDILRIMKDSRLGTYGVSGLCCMLLLKWSSLTALGADQLLIGLILAHSLSRAFSISLIALLPYVQADTQSKAKPIAQQWRVKDLCLAWCWALIPLFFVPVGTALTLLLMGALVTLAIRRWFKLRLLGYTGDALGASQQVHELLIYIALVAFMA